MLQLKSQRIRDVLDNLLIGRDDLVVLDQRFLVVQFSQKPQLLTVNLGFKISILVSRYARNPSHESIFITRLNLYRDQK